MTDLETEQLIDSMKQKIEELTAQLEQKNAEINALKAPKTEEPTEQTAEEPKADEGGGGAAAEAPADETPYAMTALEQLEANARARKLREQEYAAAARGRGINVGTAADFEAYKAARAKK